MAGFQQGGDITDPNLRGAINVERGVRNDSMAMAIEGGAQIAGMGLQKMAKNQLLGDEGTYDNVEVTEEEDAEMASILSQEGSQVFTEGLTDLTKLGKARKGGYLSASEARIRANAIQRNVGSTLVGSFMQPELEQAASKFTGNVRGTGRGMFESTPLEKQREAKELVIQNYVDAGMDPKLARDVTNKGILREQRLIELDQDQRELAGNTPDVVGYASGVAEGMRESMWSTANTYRGKNGFIAPENLSAARGAAHKAYKNARGRLKNYVKGMPTDGPTLRNAEADLLAAYETQLKMIENNIGMQAMKDFSSSIDTAHEIKFQTGPNAEQFWLAKTLPEGNYKIYSEIQDNTYTQLELAIKNDLSPAFKTKMEAYSNLPKDAKRTYLDSAAAAVGQGTANPTQSFLVSQVMKQGLPATKALYGSLNGGDWQGIVKNIVQNVPESIGAMAGPTWTGMDMEIEELTASMPQYITSTRNRMPAFKEGEKPVAFPEYRLRESREPESAGLDAVIDTYKGMFMPTKYNDRGKILGARNKQERTMVREWLNVLNAHPSIWKGIGADSAIEYINAKIDPRKMKALEDKATQ